MDTASPVGLPVWRDPQGYVLVEHVRDEAWCSFQCLDEHGQPDRTVAGCLHFPGVWHICSTRFQALRGYPAVTDSDLRSYYLEVRESGLLKRLEAERAEHDPAWREYDRRDYRHWIVESHDFYTEIIAPEPTFSRIEGTELSRLLSTWDAV